MSRKKKLKKLHRSVVFSQHVPSAPKMLLKGAKRPQAEAESYLVKARSTTDPTLARGYRNLAAQAMGPGSVDDDLARLRRALESALFGAMDRVRVRAEITRLEGTKR